MGSSQLFCVFLGLSGLGGLGGFGFRIHLFSEFRCIIGFASLLARLLGLRL